VTANVSAVVEGMFLSACPTPFSLYTSGSERARILTPCRDRTFFTNDQKSFGDDTGFVREVKCFRFEPARPATGALFSFPSIPECLRETLVAIHFVVALRR
jgi:hypothetical protein